MNILIIAGEVSGDAYAANLVLELKKNQQKATIFSIGGDQLLNVSDHFIFQSAYSHGVGVHSKFLKLKFKLNLLKALKDVTHKHYIDLAIIIDFQHLNFQIASCLQEKKIPIYTFITPNFWMWKDKKQSFKVAAYSKKIFTIFKQEYDFYKPFKNETYFFGHPLTHLKKPSTETDIYPVAPKITLLPGSRKQEFSLYLTKMLRVCENLHQTFPNLTINIILSSPYFKTILQEKCSRFQDLPISILVNDATTSIQESTLVMSASGSATLECILENRPLIVFAALPTLTYLIAKYVLRIKLTYISLPNFLANEAIVPEFVQRKINVNTISLLAIKILQSPNTYTKHYGKVLACIYKQDNIYRNITKEIL